MPPSTLTSLIVLLSLNFISIYSTPQPPLPESAVLHHWDRQQGTDALSFEPCLAESQDNCQFPRICRPVADPDSVCTHGQCFCLPNSPRECSSHSHCVENEVCAEIKGFGTLCAAESFVSDNPDAQKLPGDSTTPPPFPSTEGLTFDPCEEDSCAIPRFCRSAPKPELPCRADNTCQCLPNRMIFCSSSDECVIGEVCASVPDVGTVCASESFVRHISSSADSSHDLEIVEVSPQPTPPVSSSSTDSNDEDQPEETESESDLGFGPLCIAIEFLDHLPREALRFEMDSLASVLCDEYGSCATPGHIVTYHGEPMMMNSYCQRVKCTRQLSRVNSPRYKRRMTISTRTAGLTFTAFAARYGTFAEEQILKAAVRVGF